jgi:hypothetical protein
MRYDHIYGLQITFENLWVKGTGEVRNAEIGWASSTDEVTPSRATARKAATWSTESASGQRHMMVAYGYVTVGGVNYVSIHDPWAPCVGDTRIITYDAWIDGPGYSHWDDFYKIRK